MNSTSKRLFVGGLSAHAANEPNILKRIFERYGAIDNISIRGKQKSGRKKKVLPYAFVTYADEGSVERALVATTTATHDIIQSNREYFEIVEVATGGDGGGTGREHQTKNAAGESSDAAEMLLVQERKEEEANRLLTLAGSCNLIVQCPTTHSDRLIQYIADLSSDAHGIDNNTHSMTHVVKGSYDDKRGETILFIHSSSNLEGLLKQLSETSYVRHVIKKVYIIESSSSSVSRLNNDMEAAAGEVTSLLEQKFTLTNNNDDDENGISIRISSFPPRIAPEFATFMERTASSLDIKMSPTNESHVVSIIQLNDELDDGKHISIMSITNATRLPKFGQSITTDISSSSPTTIVCRAQRKIEEAFERYRYSNELVDATSGSIALDCGAAPGGWTFFLSKMCSRVLSVDPGELSDEVSCRDNVQHFQMPIGNAIGDISTQLGQNKICLWVSDMCLHNMGEQIDCLLRVKEKGILTEDAYFIFTLKCVRSKSKCAVDRQVKEEVSRLDGITCNVQILHLFSNRCGERSIVGRFVKL